MIDGHDRPERLGVRELAGQDLVAQARILAFELAQGDRLLDQGDHLALDDGFDQVVIGPEAQGLGDALDTGLTGDHHDGAGNAEVLRLAQEIEAGAAELRKVGAGDAVKILTSCPSCLQGLSRYENDADISADYIVVEMAKAILGPDWMQGYIRAATSGGIERVLL